MNILTILSLISAAVAALKESPGITGEVAAWISVIEQAVASATAAHTAAQAKVDPSALTPETPVA